MAERPQWSTIGRMFSDNAERYADRMAVIDGERRLTYRELHGEVRELARALIASGVCRGDLVACWAPNSWRFVTLAHAVWFVGAVTVPMSSRLKAMEVGPVLEKTGAKILFTVSECAGNRFIAMLREAYGEQSGDALFARLPALGTLVRLDLDCAAASDDGIGYRDFVATGRAIGERRLDDIAGTVDGEDVCEIVFTSGTTGLPKGVQLDHAQLLCSYWDWSGIGALRPGDNYLVIAPFSHGFGLNAGIVASALRGMCMVLIEIFEPGLALDLIERHGVSVMGGPPALFTRLMDQPEHARRNIGSLRVAFVGAASVPVETLKRIRSELGFDRVINAYGLMEACVVSMTREDDDPDVIATTAGRPLPDIDVKIVDDTGSEAAVGDPGEILVRGYVIMKGYWRDAAQTEAAMTGDGWFRTGDIGIRDRAGNLRIVDRKKDMFISGGFNAYPAEIENLLLAMEGISAVSVVGIPDPDRGEVGVAFVVPASGRRVDEAAVIAWAKAHMAGYKAPRRVFVLPALPLSANGKVMKDSLRREAMRTMGQSP